MCPKICVPARSKYNYLGQMKDELCVKIMTEFVALRGKMYPYRKRGEEKNWRRSTAKLEEKQCKGTRKCVVAEGLTFDYHKTCLFDGETVYREQMLFENKKHKFYTVNKHKIALNRDDDKKLAQVNGITTLARGHVALSA